MTCSTAISRAMEIGPVYDRRPLWKCCAAEEKREAASVSGLLFCSAKKCARFFKMSVDTMPATPLYAAHQRGRRAAGANEFALVKSREPRKRHSPGFEAKAEKVHDTAFAVSVL